MERAAFLETLGVPDGRIAIGRQFQLLGPTEDTLRAGAEWLKSQGLDLKRMMKNFPQLLTMSPELLLTKLDFVCTVAGLAKADIQPVFLACSLEARMRLRYFYALQRNVAHRYSFSTLMQRTDADFLQLVSGQPASKTEVAAYKAHVASPEFRAYMDEEERAIRARGPRVEQ